MFQSLRNSIANFIAPQRGQLTLIAHNQSDLKGNLSAPAVKRSVMPEQEAPVALHGELSLDQLMDLHSIRVKDSIFNFAAWSCLANAFSAYMNTVGKRKPSEREVARMYKNMDHFHAWNSSMQSPMDIETIEGLVVRLAVVKPAKENAQTDAILARVKNTTVEDVRKQREERAAKTEAKRVEHITGFIGELEGCTCTEDVPMIAAQHAHAKAVDCLAWMAEWNSPDIGEILIAEADIKTLERYSNRAERMEGGGEGSREIDELLLGAEGMAQGSHK